MRPLAAAATHGTNPSLGRDRQQKSVGMIETQQCQARSTARPFGALLGKPGPALGLRLYRCELVPARRLAEPV
jgi:hypothetical protein